MPGFVVYIKRHLPSAPFFESHSHRRSRLSLNERTQPSITRSARLIPLQRAARCKSPPGCLLIAHEVWRLKPFPLRSKVIRLQLVYAPLIPHRGRMIAFATAVRSGPSALRGFPVSLDFTYFTKCKETLQFFLFKKCVTCIE